LTVDLGGKSFFPLLLSGEINLSASPSSLSPAHLSSAEASDDAAEEEEEERAIG